MEIDALVQNKLDADVDFQAELDLLSEEERPIALANKKAELIKQEFEAITAKAVKAEEIAKNQKIRAEKAEQEAKEAKTAGGVNPPEVRDTLSIKDIRALQDVPEEDIDEVIEFSKYKKISITEAKNHPAVQSLLKTRLEERKTAYATNTGGSKRSVSKNTDADLLERVSAGQLPESDDDIKRLAEARLAKRIADADNRRT